MISVTLIQYELSLIAFSAGRILKCLSAVKRDENLFEGVHRAIIAPATLLIVQLNGLCHLKRAHHPTKTVLAVYSNYHI